MNTSVSNTTPAPPSIIAALRAGFDAIANKIIILLFPITVDLFIWLGPHIRIKQVILELFNQLTQSPGWEDSPSKELIETNVEFLTQLSERVNLMALLRSYPVGIPSLMAGRQPVETPLSKPIFWNLSSLSSIMLIGISIVLLGLAAGTIYYLFVSHIVLHDSMDVGEVIRDFPRSLIQIIIFVIILLGLIIILSIPVSCLLSFIAVSGLSIGQFMIFLYIGFLLWIIFPLLLTPQVIIVRKNNALAALRNSLNITRMTLPTTGMLFVVIFLISEGLDILWRIPEENSWLTILGILGHAFVTTSLLAATFIYYRDADRWVQSVFRKILLSSKMKSNN